MKYLFPLMLLFIVSCETIPRTVHEEEVSKLNRKIDELEMKANELDKLREENALLREKLKIQGVQNNIYNTLSAELKKILDSLVEDGVQMLPGDRWRFEVDLLFKPGSDDISSKGVEVLKKFANAWKGQNVGFKIEGHTDKDPIVRTATVYRTKTNLELGAARGIAVMDVLVKNGIPEKSITVVSKGNNSPAAPNDDKAENKKKNRRVEISILQ
ncbi:MAG: OmpA family protein [Planctomycetes bacterium]|nr:OmpA family protein [Planctomycetota bacterium]